MMILVTKTVLGLKGSDGAIHFIPYLRKLNHSFWKIGSLSCLPMALMSSNLHMCLLMSYSIPNFLAVYMLAKYWWAMSAAILQKTRFGQNFWTKASHMGWWFWCLFWGSKNQIAPFIFTVYLSVEVTDGRVVTAGVSVTWCLLTWSRGHEFEPWLGRTWGA